MSAPVPPDMIQPSTATPWWRSGRVTAIVVLILALAVGIAIGVALDRRMIAHRWHAMRDGPRPGMGGPGPSRGGADSRGMRDRMTRDLDLTAAQAAQVDSIMQRRTPAFRTVHEETQRRIKAMIDTTNMQIESVLTPEQREKFQEIRARRDAERRERTNRFRERRTP